MPRWYRHLRTRNDRCTQSKFFANDCKPGHVRIRNPALKTSGLGLISICVKEGEEGIVNLKIGKDDIIKAMLGHLYGQDHTAADTSGYITDYFANLYVAADLYDTPLLREHVEERYIELVERVMNEPEEAASIMKRLYTDEFLNEEPLRKMLCQHAVAHLDKLLDPALPDAADVAEAIEECPGFGRDIAVLSANKIGAKKASWYVFKCPVCAHHEMGHEAESPCQPDHPLSMSELQ